VDLRCDGKLHGRVEDTVFEVTCKSRFCGWKPGVVVLHRFSVVSGELINTRLFKNPDGRSNAPHHDPAAVRSA
jgi:hypothetical protein